MGGGTWRAGEAMAAAWRGVRASRGRFALHGVKTGNAGCISGAENGMAWHGTTWFVSKLLLFDHGASLPTSACLLLHVVSSLCFLLFVPTLSLATYV